MGASAEPVQANVQMEVVRACGLFDAVDAAVQWTGGEYHMWKR